ncbi:hypothetical protein QUF90_06490 [Desulfococcaceae bacterium HSG9]|nr:hypothetical protein [Desulfococcaceae bacterium HSG9]
MEFENIVVIIAVIWYVVSLFKKKKPKPKAVDRSQKDAQAKQGIMSHLGDKIRETVKELERQAAEAQRKQQEAKTDSGDSSGEWDRFREKDEELQWEAESDFENEDSEEDTFTRPAREVKVTAPPPADTDQKQGTVSAAITLPGEASFTPEILRNAVVWSEILAPPLALREERGSMHD